MSVCLVPSALVFAYTRPPWPFPPSFYFAFFGKSSIHEVTKGNDTLLACVAHCPFPRWKTLRAKLDVWMAGYKQGAKYGGRSFGSLVSNTINQSDPSPPSKPSVAFSIQVFPCNFRDIPPYRHIWKATSWHRQSVYPYSNINRPCLSLTPRCRFVSGLAVQLVILVAVVVFP